LKISRLKKATKFSKNFLTILLQKGLDSNDKIKNFLDCDIKKLHDPLLLPDMNKCIKRIKIARDKNEKIIIYGDYDADGTIAASVLTRALFRIGFNKKNILVLTPHRKYGYGLNNYVVDTAKRLNYSLIITCDCGSSDDKQISLANDNKIDVIVLDHHNTITAKPLALVNAQRKDSKYPFKELCGAGVVFKVIQALELSGENLNALSCLDYIAIATVADVSPLIDENRIIVKYGMQKLSKTKQIPLLTMMNKLNIFGRKITSEVIGFMIGPRLNAPGRMSSANITIKFLLCNNEIECERLYRKLNNYNEKRKLIEREIKENVISLLNSKLNDKILVISSDKWNKGVIGIVASVITQFYTRPTILIAIDSDGIGYGSIRNIEGFPLLESLQKCNDLLERFGGHAMAAGIKIKKENIEAFSLKINEIADKIMPIDSLIPSTKANLELKEKEITFEFLNELMLLEPYGSENEEPSFIIRDVKVVEKKVKDRHLILKISQLNKTLSAPAFWLNEYSQIMKDDNQQFDVLFSLSENLYKNGKYLQLMVEDIQEVKLNW